MSKHMETSNMGDPVTITTGGLFKIAEIIVIFVLGIFGWHFRTQAQRMRNLEDTAVRREELKQHRDDFTDTIKTLRVDLNKAVDTVVRSNSGLQRRIDSMYDRLPAKKGAGD